MKFLNKYYELIIISYTYTIGPIGMAKSIIIIDYYESPEAIFCLQTKKNLDKLKLA